MLRRSRLFRDYEGVFTKAIGLPLTLRPLEYWQLAHHGKKQENPFCALLAENPATLAVCLQAHDEMIRHTGNIPHTVTCPFGLTETAVPVTLGQETIGYLRIGQVLRHMPVKSDTTKISRELAQHGVKFTTEIRKTWKKNPLMPPDKYNAIVRLLTFFAEQLSALINQIVVGESRMRSHRSCRRPANTSTNTKPRNYRWPMSPKRRAQACFISAKFFTRARDLSSPTMSRACVWRMPGTGC